MEDSEILYLGYVGNGFLIVVIGQDNTDAFYE